MADMWTLPEPVLVRPGGELVAGEKNTHEFVFLGTSSGCGVPAFFCDCPACQEAREHPEYHRTCCGAVVKGRCNLLIDTPPDLRIQLVREGIDSVAGIAYTHTHYDHFASLGEIEYLVRLHTGILVPVYVGEEGFDEIATMFGYMKGCLDRTLVKPYETFEFDGVTYEAIPATHSKDTYGWLMTYPSGATMMYMCDTATLAPAVAEHIRGRVDVIAWDSTCWGTNKAPDTHHNSQQAVEEALDLGAKHVYLTHLAPHFADIPACHDDMEAFAAQYDGRVHVAYDGLTLRF